MNDYGVESSCGTSEGHVDPLWYLKNSTLNKNNHFIALPELEPMKIDTGLPLLFQPLWRTISVSVPFGSTAKLPCPVRQLGKRTVSQFAYIFINAAINNVN